MYPNRKLKCSPTLTILQYTFFSGKVTDTSYLGVFQDYGKESQAHDVLHDYFKSRK